MGHSSSPKNTHIQNPQPKPTTDCSHQWGTGHSGHFRPGPWGSDTCTPPPSHLSRVSLSEFRIFSSAVRCNTGNVIDELLPKLVLSIGKSCREYMNYFSVDACHKLQVIKFSSLSKSKVWKCFLPSFRTMIYPLSFLILFVYGYIPLCPLSKVQPFLFFEIFFNKLL